MKGGRPESTPLIIFLQGLLRRQVHGSGAGLETTLVIRARRGATELDGWHELPRLASSSSHSSCQIKRGAKAFLTRSQRSPTSQVWVGFGSAATALSAIFLVAQAVLRGCSCCRDTQIMTDTMASPPCLQSILLIDFGYTWNVQPLVSPSSDGPPSQQMDVLRRPGMPMPSRPLACEASFCCAQPAGLLVRRDDERLAPKATGWAWFVGAPRLFSLFAAALALERLWVGAMLLSLQTQLLRQSPLLPTRDVTSSEVSSLGSRLIGSGAACVVEFSNVFCVQVRSLVQFTCSACSRIDRSMPISVAD